MTELTSNARFIQGVNMLTSKIQDPIALEELVKAMEACLEGKEYGSSGVDGSGLVEALVKQEAVQPKHPLEDYQITEKDVGSLVYVWDAGDEEYPNLDKLLVYNVKAEFYPYAATVGNYRYAKPYLDPIALHFIQFYATENSVAPDDLGDYFAALWDDGDVILYHNDIEELYTDLWQWYGTDNKIIGYRPLKFVNPLEGV